eukprot:jgi/Mesvir1/22757/Mv14156-RA.1
MAKISIRYVAPHRHWWLMIIGLIFAAYDAYGIGANDVANSFANAVAARTLTMYQACGIAAVAEFVGAIALGQEVTDTLKGKVLSASVFDNQQDLLMLGFVCALVGSSIFVNWATIQGMPVSTTHAIVGAIIGVGIAFRGKEAINWGNWEVGVYSILVGWGISPGIAGGAAACYYLVTKYTVLHPRWFGTDTYKKARVAMPIYVLGTIVIISFFMFYKGFGKVSTKIRARFDDNKGPIVGIAFAAGVFFAIVTQFLVLPYMTKKFATMPDSTSAVPIVSADTASTSDVSVGIKDGAESEGASEAGTTSAHQSKFHPLQQSYKKVKAALLSGMQHDTVNVSADVKHLAEMHRTVQRYDNKTELVFSWIQVITCSFASLAHGANDVANAVGPLAGIMDVWQEGGIFSSKKKVVKKWILAYGGFFIVVGLATRGWYIMAALGNNMTPITPTRGFAMELGAVTAVLIATVRGLPVSTTQCICGGTLAVGLCNGNLAAVNWRMILWTILSWILTLPFAGGFAGLLFAFVAYSPKALDCTDKFVINGVDYPTCRPRPYGFEFVANYTGGVLTVVDM